MDEATAAQGRAFDANMPRLGQYAQTMTDIQGQQAPQMLQQYLTNQRVGGPALVGMAIDAVKQADPSGFALRESLMQKAQEGLAAGGGFSPTEMKMMQEDYRQAQVNRGFGTGLSDALDETAFLQSQRFGRDQARQASAMQILSGRTPMDQFAQVNQAGKISPFMTQDVGAISGQLIPSTGQLMGFGQNAYGQQVNNVAQQNALKQHQFEFGVQNTSNPLQEDIMFGLQVGQGLSKMAGSAAGAAASTAM
jgi:hypothetical protein